MRNSVKIWFNQTRPVFVYFPPFYNANEFRTHLHINEKISEDVHGTQTRSGVMVVEDESIELPMAAATPNSVKLCVHFFRGKCCFKK